MAAAGVLLAGDKDFNGRWDIKVQNEVRSRVWWLEVNGAGSKNPSGKFVGAPGGDMDVIPSIQIEGGELRFSFDRKYRLGDKSRWDVVRKGVYTARLRDGKLIGTFALDGQPVYSWTGYRAPVIRDKDDGSWKEGKPIELMNGRDLNAWSAMVAGQDLGWTAADGEYDDDKRFPETGGFHYHAPWHDPYQKRVLGVELEANQPPLADGMAVLDLAAFHPGTAIYLSRKLCRRFIANFQ